MRLSIADERWPIEGDFRIARGNKREAEVVVVTLREGDHAGRGECVPYARYGETIEGVKAALEGARGAIEAGAQPVLHGAAASALDAARLDLEAKRTGVPVWDRLKLGAPAPVEIAWTLSIDAPEAMAERARLTPMRRLKVKLGGDGSDVLRLQAIRAARPDARLWLDANEGLNDLQALLPTFGALGVDLLEQPFPAGHDAALSTLKGRIPFCADESFAHDVPMASLVDRYDAVNVKLDKAGGLSGALRSIEEARRLGLRVVLGCMVSTSLSIAPALCLAQRADDVDLDGALLLARDRDDGPRLEGGLLVPRGMAGWGR